MPDPARPPDEEFVPIYAYRATTAGLVAIIKQLVQTTNAMALILRQRGIITPELWNAHIDEAARAEYSQAILDAVDELRGNPSLQDILNGFDDPAQ
jgi:hypothetical protein